MSANDRSYTILGNSPAVKQLLALIAKVANAKTNILIIGESGTGKELVARSIHEGGPLKGKPFIPVNCGAIPENLIESEMFGHKRGSFTGAVSEKEGLFEAAHGGTLFLDEVGELPLHLQVKMLRALQERVIRRVGGNDDIRVDVRVIAATNRDLEAAIAKGTFREDLYYRLNVILIKTPPLRERTGDIKLLAEHFVSKFTERSGKKMGIDPTALAALENYAWPGNVRELENSIERAVTLENGDRVTLATLPPAIQSSIRPQASPGTSPTSETGTREVAWIELPVPDFRQGSLSLDDALAKVERVYLTQALAASGGVKKKAAELLGITFRSIRYRLKKLGIETHEQDDELESGEAEE